MKRRAPCPLWGPNTSGGEEGTELRFVWFAGGMPPDSGDWSVSLSPLWVTEGSRCFSRGSVSGVSPLGCLDRITLASSNPVAALPCGGWTVGVPAPSPVSPSRLHVLPAPAHPSVALISGLHTMLPFWPYYIPKRLVMPIPLHGISHPKPMHGLTTSPLQDIRALGSCEMRPAPKSSTQSQPAGPSYVNTPYEATLRTQSNLPTRQRDSEAHDDGMGGGARGRGSGGGTAIFSRGPTIPLMGMGLETGTHGLGGSAPLTTITFGKVWVTGVTCEVPVKGDPCRLGPAID
jgi:hypothetical protein